MHLYYKQLIKLKMEYEGQWRGFRACLVWFPYYLSIKQEKVTPWAGTESSRVPA